MSEPTPGLDGRLFAAAREGDVETLAAVELLLGRGLDVNAREEGDDTYAMHWAAAAGHLDVVRRLADAGGDVVGRGDDHGLEVIGWATCWEGCDDAAHRAVADFLVARGARHHVFSAVAMGLEDEVRRIVAEDPGALRRPMRRQARRRRDGLGRALRAGRSGGDPPGARRQAVTARRERPERAVSGGGPPS
ncbi:MAG: ankyrin repeat domain-containing protein [Longimicrobiaceae bacterium]